MVQRRAATVEPLTERMLLFCDEILSRVMLEVAARGAAVSPDGHEILLGNLSATPKRLLRTTCRPVADAFRTVSIVEDKSLLHTTVALGTLKRGGH